MFSFFNVPRESSTASPPSTTKTDEAHHRVRAASSSTAHHDLVSSTSLLATPGGGLVSMGPPPPVMKHHPSDVNLDAIESSSSSIIYHNNHARHWIDTYVLRVPHLSKLLGLLTLRRIATLVVGIVLLISGMGTMSYWLLRRLYKETFVPFGLSTFRSLNWEWADYLLLASCFAGAYVFILNKQPRQRAVGIFSGGIFVLMGILGLYVDSSPSWSEAVKRSKAASSFSSPSSKGKPEELQPLFLNVWFVIWGSIVLILSGWRGLELLDVIRKAPLYPW